MAELFAREKFQRVVHLGAQAGVRYSLKRPAQLQSAAMSSVRSMFWKAAAIARLRHLVYASTSSVYGANTKMPFSVHEPASHPLSVVFREQAR